MKVKKIYNNQVGIVEYDTMDIIIYFLWLTVYYARQKLLGTTSDLSICISYLSLGAAYLCHLYNWAKQLIANHVCICY